jgi:hypothetical protein
MAQYEDSTTAVTESLESSGLDTDTSSAITSLLNESSTEGKTSIVDYDGSTSTEGADVVRVTASTQLNKDPGAPVILMDADSQGADLIMQADTGRVVVAGGGDDSIVAVGTGNVTVETGGGNDTVLTGDGQDQVTVTGSGDSSVNTGNGDDTLKITGDGNVTVNAGTGDDVIVVASEQGSATVRGGDGFDRVQMDDTRDNHTFTIDDNGILVMNSAPTQLDDVEIVEFNNGETVIADSDAKSNVARLYEVLFDREGDIDGLKYWMNEADEGASINQIAGAFEDSEEFQNEFGNDSDEQFVNKLYDYMAGRDADQEGFNYWMDSLADGQSRADVAVSFAASEEAIELMGIDGTKYVIDVDDLA